MWFSYLASQSNPTGPASMTFLPFDVKSARRVMLVEAATPGLATKVLRCWIVGAELSTEPGATKVLGVRVPGSQNQSESVAFIARTYLDVPCHAFRRRG